jgi:hypothetical protein
MFLLNTSYLKNQKKETILKLARMKLEGGMSSNRKGLFSKQPVWKTCVVAALITATIKTIS